ncbi:MAG: nucleotidyltransferase domain-containing protein [Armatimonadota bacterium]
MQSTHECLNLTHSEALTAIYRSTLLSDPSSADYLADATVSWEDVWTLAENERLYSWCLDFVTRHPETITDERLLRWRQDYFTRIGQNQSALKELAEISEACQNAGIRVIALKGTAFLLWLYQDPGIRTFCDIDLLVDDRDTLKTIDILNSMGYELDHAHTFITSTEVLFHICRLEGGHLPPLHQEGHFPIELHIDILRGRGDWGAAWDDIRCDSIIAHYGKTGITTLSPEHSLIYASVHYAKHLSLNQQQSQWLLDIAMMICRPGLLDWDKLHRTADHWEVTDDLYISMKAVQDTFGIDVPLPDRKPTKRILRKVPSAIEKIGCLPTPALKLRYLRDNVFPSPEYMYETFGRREEHFNLYRAYLRLYIQRIKSVLGVRDRV